MPSEKIELNGKALVARELTVNEVEKILKNLESQEMHPLEQLFPEEPVPALAMGMSLEVDPEQLLDLPHSKLVTLFGEVKKENPFLVQAVERLAAVGQRIAALENEDREEESIAPSTSSAATAAD